MAILEILQHPDRRLRQKAHPVEQVDDDVRSLVDNMFDTMYAAPGIGLAAPQVADMRRVVVMDVSSDGDEPRVLINPRITEAGGEQVNEEGCLSLEGVQESVRRADHVVVEALDRDGAPYSFSAEGLLAACVQHELDHLDGRLIIDYLSWLKRERIEKRLAKERKRAAEDRRKAG